jgi:hypothetical protein
MGNVELLELVGFVEVDETGSLEFDPVIIPA